MIWLARWSKCGVWYDTLMDDSRSNNLLSLQVLEPPGLTARIVAITIGPLKIGIGYSRRMTPKLEKRAALRAAYTALRRTGAFPPCDNCIPSTTSKEF